MNKVLLGILLGAAITTTVSYAVKENDSDPKEQGTPCICPPEDSKPSKQL